VGRGTSDGASPRPKKRERSSPGGTRDLSTESEILREQGRMSKRSLPCSVQGRLRGPDLKIEKGALCFGKKAARKEYQLSYMVTNFFSRNGKDKTDTDYIVPP